MQHLGGYVTIYSHINRERDVWERPGGRGGGDELSLKYMQHAAAPLKIQKRLKDSCSFPQTHIGIFMPVCFPFSAALFFPSSNSMGREDIQTCQDYNIRLFYSMWRGRGGGREVTLTLLICGGVGEGRGGGEHRGEDVGQGENRGEHAGFGPTPQRIYICCYY